MTSVVARWVIGLTVALGVGQLVSYYFVAFLRRRVAEETGGERGIPAWVTGTTERLFFTVAVAWQVPGALIAMIAWLGAKMAASWNRQPSTTISLGFSGLLGGLVSMFFAFLGGLVCSGQAGAWLWEAMVPSSADLARRRADVLAVDWVQALSAAAVAVLTIALVWVTTKYAAANERMAQSHIRDAIEGGPATPPHGEPPPQPQVIAIVDSAIREYQHAETVVQSRLYNFLFAESILLLSWAAVFAANDNGGRRIVLTVLALLATVLGIVWALVGARHKVFLQLHTHIVRTHESRLPAALRIHEPISQLQGGAVLTIDDRKKLVIGPLLRFFGERNLATTAPLIMALASAILLYVALTR